MEHLHILFSDFAVSKRCYGQTCGAPKSPFKMRLILMHWHPTDLIDSH